MRYLLLLVFLFGLMACSKKDEPAPASIQYECKLPETKEHAYIGIGFPKAAARAPSTGTSKVTVIFVDFSDAPASRAPEEIFKLISPASETFLSTVSYGRLSVSFDPVFKWFRMSKPTTAYDRSAFKGHNEYLREAIALADPTVDFSNTDAFVVISNPDAGSINRGYAYETSSPDGIPADGRYLNNASSSGRELSAIKELWFPHEYGHNMTLVDLYGYDGMAYRYMGDFSLMSKTELTTAPEHTGWERWLLGWLDDGQVACSSSLGSNASVILTPIENKGGLKILVIPIDVNMALIVESRRATGYDKSLEKEGPLVYSVDTRLGTGLGTMRVLPLNDNDTQKRKAILSVGESVSVAAVTVTFTAKDAAGDHIQFSIR